MSLDRSWHGFIEDQAESFRRREHMEYIEEFMPRPGDLDAAPQTQEESDADHD